MRLVCAVQLCEAYVASLICERMLWMSKSFSQLCIWVLLLNNFLMQVTKNPLEHSLGYYFYDFRADVCREKKEMLMPF